MIKAVLFDMDGVLVSSFNAFYHTTNHLLERHGKKKITKKEFRSKYWGTYIDKDLRRMFKKKDVRKEHAEFFRLFYKNGKHVDAFPGIKPVLRKLGKKYKLAVVTNTPKKPAMFILKATGLDKMFDTITTGDIVKNPKPAPDIVYLACRRLKVRAEEAVMVGDMTHDILAGNRAGAFTIGVRKGLGAKRFSTIKNLPKLLENI